MFDEEYDYFEQIESFRKVIDNQVFLDSYEAAKKLREKRLDIEFEPIWNDYQKSLTEYNKQKEEYDKRTLSKLWKAEPIEPIKPERRK